MPAMQMQHRFLATLTIASFLLLIGACRSPSPTNHAPQPKTLTAADLTKLRWIEGSWRGTGDVDKPFYERYKFENDTTLVVESIADETFKKVNDVSRFY